MSYSAAICPKCHKYLLVKDNVPFLVCPVCGESISNQESTALLRDRCHDADNVNNVIADCITLELQYGPELPYLVLCEIVEAFPHQESPAYLLTKMAGYSVAAVRAYLKNFAPIKSEPSNVAWAEEFLDNCLTYQNMEFADLFLTYIQNKITPSHQNKYFEKLQKLRKEYTFKASNPRSTKTLMALYIVSSVLNVLLFPTFMLLSGWLAPILTMYYAINIGISIILVCVEVLLLYIHHQVYGNRLGMPQRERLWMVIFLSTMIFALGAAFMGSVWKITLW